MGVFDPDQILSPGGGLLGTQEMEASLKFLIHALRLATGLRVEP